MAYIKTFPIILIAILVLALGIYYLTDNQPWRLNTGCLARHVNQPAQTITWTTYRNNQYGFTIKYPSVYSINELPKPIQTSGRYKFVSIVDHKDTCTYEFHVVPAAVAIIKQPIFKDEVFHNLEEYIKAGFAYLGNARTKDELVSINGVNALHSHYTAYYPQEDAAYERYVIIRDALIYQIDLKTDDPFREEFLRSFNLNEASGARTTWPERPANTTPWTAGSAPK